MYKEKEFSKQEALNILSDDARKAAECICNSHECKARYSCRHKDNHYAECPLNKYQTSGTGTGNATNRDIAAVCACCSQAEVIGVTSEDGTVQWVKSWRTDSYICTGCPVRQAERRLHNIPEPEKERIVSLEETQELFRFLQGEVPDGFNFNAVPKLNAEEAFTVIYYLQEKLQIIPDTYEMCDGCHELYDSDYEGESIEETEGSDTVYRQYCDGCFLNHPY